MTNHHKGFEINHQSIINQSSSIKKRIVQSKKNKMKL